MNKMVLGVAVMLALGGCGDESAGGSASPSAHTFFQVDTTDDLVTGTLPAIRSVCPGLNRYAGVFENVRVEQQYRTAIVFHIPEHSSIPDAYTAGGHTCFIEIESDGSAAVIDKSACKSVCLDQEQVPDGQLRLTLTK